MIMKIKPEALAAIRRLLVIAAGKDREEKTELCDLADDPGEKTNLADQHPDKTANLRKKLDHAAAADRDSVVEKEQ